MVRRRELLKLGLLSGAALVSVKRGAAAPIPDEDRPSPPTTPFVAPLPIPPPPTPVARFAAPVDCSGLVTSTTRYFHLIEEERLVQFHPQLNPTPIWGYRDVNVSNSPFALGPPFRERMQRPVVVRFTNALPTANKGFGVPQTTVHHHGGHQPSRSDGFPTLDFGPGQSYDYCYPMRDHGFSHGEPEVGERPSTNWYHDHLIDFTGPNVYKGLAGFFTVFDELDTGQETTGLRLPSGPFDVPLAIQDKRFNPDCTLSFDPFDNDGFLGDKFVVNGAIQPFLEVKRRKYRFRFLNASNARFYQLYLTKANGQTFPFDQIGTDGGLMAAPIRGIDNFQFGPAERVEVVIDFRQFQTGDSVFIENRLEQEDARKPNNLLARGTQILRFIVGESVPDPSLVPDVLRPFEPISKAVLATAQRKTLEFDRSNGSWTINGRLFDPDRPLLTPRENTPQIYRLVNKSGGWWHPIHFHLDFMRVLTRNGTVPPPNERDGIAKKDTVILRDNDVVEVFLRFTDFRGRFVFHCHNLEHEDMAMMGRLDVV